VNSLDPHTVNPWAIDSLKIRIPLSRVKVLDSSIGDTVARVSMTTGNILEEAPTTKASRDERGIKTKFSIERRATEHKTVEYLVVFINAKQLGERYFEGITASNVAELHGYLMGLEVVVFSLKELLKGEATDIDFRKDFTANEEDMKGALNHMHQNTQASTDVDKGSLLFWRKDNKGLQFNKRNTTKVRTAPFLKVYSKTLDLQYKSNIFALAHFDTIPQNLWRLEFTVKNKKHLASFDVGNTFNDILSLTPLEIDTMSKRSLKAVLQPRKVDPQTKDERSITPRDLKELNYILLLLDTGMQWHMLKEAVLRGIYGSSRSKGLKRLNELYDTHIRPIERFKAHHRINDLLKTIGYEF
jgi:hypothetical protein